MARDRKNRRGSDGDGMGERFRRRLTHIGRDIRNLHNLEAYVVAAVALVVSVLSFFGDLVSDTVVQAVMLAGIGILVYRVTLPDGPRRPHMFADRSAFEAQPIIGRLESAKELWVYAPSATSLLHPAHCDVLSKHALSKPGGRVRVVILDPYDDAMMEIAARQLDRLAHDSQKVRPSVHTMRDRLAQMTRWRVTGTLEYRLLGFNPGFSMVAFDPTGRNGIIIVELHAVDNRTASDRLHFEITRADSDKWYQYWLDQLERIWKLAREDTQPRTTAEL